ncbi:MAG: tetratricopeptide repeat protein [Bacteroidetes bacterium]|nr:tetratricopeptide repeat protein [Bacteroidota bacterium]
MSKPKKKSPDVRNSLYMEQEVKELSPRLRLIFGWLLPLLAITAAFIYVLPMPGAAEERGFPYDDAYTAMSYARTMVEHGSYAAHSEAAATSGVTAPLQVLLLAVLYMIVGDMVTAGLFLGIASFAVVVVLTFLLGLRLFRNQQGFAVVAAVLLLLSPRMAAAAVSGLPTLLFTALILASAYFYMSRRSIPFFLFAGLALWTHPAALVFVLAAIAHLFYNHLLVGEDLKPRSQDGRTVSGRETAIGAVVFLFLLTAYAAFNLVLSGNFFVNTVSAKMAYYAGATSEFTSGVWQFFTRYGWAPIILFALFGLSAVVVDAIRRRPLPILMSMLFLVGMIAAYAVFHPILHDSHTLLPALPFFALLGMWGLHHIHALLTRALPLPMFRMLSLAFVVLVVTTATLFSVIDWPVYREGHYRAFRYVLHRDIAAARWIEANTPPDATIATHLPGAITFHGRRPVLDITGELSPSMLPAIGSMSELVSELRQRDIQYVAARRNHLEVVNSNPLFTSDATQADIMEVFAYTPGRTHLMSQTASALNVEAARLMQRADWPGAVRILQRSFKEDPYSSRTSTLYGLALLQLGDTANAQSYLSQALALHDEYAPAMTPLADIHVQQKRFDEGIRLLEKALEINPQSSQSQSSYRAAVRAKREDSLRAQGVHTFTFTR